MIGRGALALLVVVLGATARAQEPESDGIGVPPTTPIVGSPEESATKIAEYRRLSEEIQRLASRNQWSGVSRFYAQMEATGAPMMFADLVTGAHAARADGDAKAVRTRLYAASKLQEQRDVIEWLWEVDEHYGSVYLACDPEKKKRPELAPKALPFDPNQVKAIQFAQAKVAETCLFDGLLPGGAYTFGDYTFEVKPKIESVRIDMSAAVAEKR